MRFREITEGVEDHFLYHASRASSAARILSDDCIQGRTNHTQKALGLGKSEARSDWIAGVSLTRSRMFARGFGLGDRVIFVLDSRRLRQRYRMRPIDYYMSSYGLKRGDADDESEEFLMSMTGIRPLSRYLVKILIPEEEVEMMTQRHDIYGVVLDHPLAVVVGKDGKPRKIKEAT